MQVLLFTNKETTPRVFAALAANTQREIGASFATVHQRETAILENFKVKAVSTLMPMIGCADPRLDVCQLVSSPHPPEPCALRRNTLELPLLPQQHTRNGGDVDLGGLKSPIVAGVPIDSGSFAYLDDRLPRCLNPESHLVKAEETACAGLSRALTRGPP